MIYNKTKSLGYITIYPIYTMYVLVPVPRPGTVATGRASSIKSQGKGLCLSAHLKCAVPAILST